MNNETSKINARCTLNKDSFHKVCDNEEMTCKKLCQHVVDISITKVIPPPPLPCTCIKQTQVNADKAKAEQDKPCEMNNLYIYLEMRE